MTSRPAWRKSSYSSSNGGACVELADLGNTIGVRDSKDPCGGHINISREGLDVLLARLKQR
ncbi:DUF397 domain-containing protein [Actinomadura montaniterrae]|uniref:DUF397 domain-containing protein n=1 Tax=Actinomadura montaniterrae TaxID=1803903 RepID=A0A6L3VCQ2_9ACTN|nr:DUF397 domain-containing protein [Actinomadura montaniterrae]KAB2358382.1 DUF397 domain-containing protein [Actinomadura montaniterrae]